MAARCQSEQKEIRTRKNFQPAGCHPVPSPSSWILRPLSSCHVGAGLVPARTKATTRVATVWAQDRQGSRLYRHLATLQNRDSSSLRSEWHFKFCFQPSWKFLSLFLGWSFLLRNRIMWLCKNNQYNFYMSRRLVQFHSPRTSKQQTTIFTAKAQSAQRKQEKEFCFMVFLASLAPLRSTGLF